MKKEAAFPELADTFTRKFGTDPQFAVKSPLRICPLGAHVDHQDGIVTGMALTESVDLLAAPNREGAIRVQSRDFPDEEYFHIDEVPAMVPTFWGNYLRGAVLTLRRKHKLETGINGVVEGKLPIGGLSSSAAVTTAYLMALCRVNRIELPPLDLIQHSHWVEKAFIGLNNGILDHSANVLSRKQQLMQIDCRTSAYERIPPAAGLPDFEVAIIYSGISKNLISTAYNDRVDECKVAAGMLQQLENDTVTSLEEITLRDVSPETYSRFRDRLPGRFQRRADHFFHEQERVRNGVAAWKQGDLEHFGELMFESGASSIHHYECGCPELIAIYEMLRTTEGVYGARFSGAGYRGCCIGLIDPDAKEGIRTRIDTDYPKRFPRYRDAYRVFFCRTDDGARVTEL